MPPSTSSSPGESKKLYDRLGPPDAERRNHGKGNAVETWLDLPRFFLFGAFNWEENEYDEPRSMTCNVTSLAFSGVHLVAWNWEFLSDTTACSGASLALISTIPGVLLVYCATGLG